MINLNGERDDNTTESICKLEEDVLPPEGQSAQGDFKCSIADLEEEKYYSIRLNSSDDITGIPTDETLLDPVLTQEAIEKNQLLDYSDIENKKADKIPATFTPESIDKASCEADGKFLIKGSLSKAVEHELSFKIPLTFPDGITAQCSLTGPSEITCQVDRTIDNSNIVFEQNIIKDGPNEILNLAGIASEDVISCKNGLLIEVEKKLDVKISFRQVSHLEFNGKNGFSYFFAAFSSQSLTAKYSIKMKIIVLAGLVKKEKEATCTLKDDVAVNGDKPSQGNFECVVTVEEEEYKEINATDTESIKISTENEGISGVYEVDNNLSPLAIDNAINETKAKIEANETMTELGQCLDYSEPENMNKEPPSLDIISVSNLEQAKYGKLTLKVKFSEAITEETTFDLPLSYPQVEIKCKVIKADKDEEVDISCKSQAKFKLVEKFVFEPRLIKKKHKEVVNIRGKEIPMPRPVACEDFKSVNYFMAKKRQKADFSFLQLSNFRPGRPHVNFFMAITRAKREVEFEGQISIKIIVSITIGGLRQLQGSNTEEVEVKCDVKPDLETENSCGLDCNGNASGNVESMEFSPDNGIAGVPEEIDPTATPNIDYSDKNNLENIDKLPRIEIKSVDGSTCENNGDYIIEGEADNDGLTDTENVEIPFSSPDSRGLCNIKVDGKKSTMTCHNKEKFTTSQILFESNTIKDSKGKPLFILDSYTNLKSFACAISENSVLPIEPNSTITPSPNENNGNNPNQDPNDSINDDKEKHHSYYKDSSSKGLSGGAIAAIIITIIAVLAILVGVFFYCKGRTKPPIQSTFDNSSTFQNINEAPNPNNF